MDFKPDFSYEVGEMCEIFETPSAAINNMYKKKIIIKVSSCQIL